MTQAQEYNVVPVAFNPATGFNFTGLDEMFRVANCYLQSGLAPDSFRTAQQLIVCWANGAELGLKPLQAMKVLVVINNRVTIMGDGALGLVRKSGLLDGEPKVEYAGEGETRSCTVTVKRKGADSPRSASFSMKEAKTAGLLDRPAPRGIPPWKAYPDRMLYYRPLGFVLRDAFSDVLMGMPIYEEVRDIPTEEETMAEEVRKAREYTQEVAKTTEVIGADQPLPSPAEEVEPAFEEDKTQTAPETTPPFAAKLGEQYPQAAEPPPSKPPPEAEQSNQQQAWPPGPQSDDIDLSFDPASAKRPPEKTELSQPRWKDHVIRAIPHAGFFGRRIGELSVKDLQRIEKQWIPKVKPRLDEASDEQKEELPLFEEAIAYSKLADLGQ
jgi:hypothetical protein